MKKISALLLIILSAFLLFSCENEKNDEGEIPEGAITMTGVVTDVGDRIAILVSEGAYKEQPMHILTSDTTKFFDNDGNKTAKNSVKVGDTIAVTYNGQVMMSYPGQISALAITIK